MADAQIPEGLTAEYENVGARSALDALQAEPDYERLAAFLAALREGYLIADVTGTPRKKATRIRTIRSTTGQLLLPLFTSMAELRRAVPNGRAEQAKGAIMPASEALGLIRTGRFVAAQFDAGSAALVVLRTYVELVLGGEPLDAATVEGLR
ncbi:SseB family protein [Leucobacter weissii]|uniref:SseB family protein n=1 Tax=Leucobacter weissii TaxID=1983706 RepID=A0A939S7Y3_9MICO|nr:SseB family protein [Leucobacter weissii]MBO1901466.1 SseB family protein [Leucobacter weissii]